MPTYGVTVVDADADHCREICALLKQANVSATFFHSLEGLLEHLKREPVKTLLVDLDNLQVDNAFFRNLKKQLPGLHILCLSSRRHHPSLAESMGSYIYASLAKPLNAEELFFWLKSIAET